SSTSLKPVSRTPSLKTAIANSLGGRTLSSSSSIIASPVIAAMGDLTPLPSPLMSGSPGPWKLLGSGSPSLAQRREVARNALEGSVLVTKSGESVDAALYNAPKRKLYASIDAGKPIPAPLVDGSADGSSSQHARNRSVSEYVPGAVSTPQRPMAVSGTHIKIDIPDDNEQHMRREQNMAESRGLTSTIQKPPTPPPSESSKDSMDGRSAQRSTGVETFEACGRHDQKRRRWRSVRLLGQGTFSRVMLATSQKKVADDDGGSDSDGTVGSATEGRIDRKTLVAVKVCEHGPRGGASEDRVEMSLKRELEILQSIHHPCLIDLKAWSIEPSRAILVLSYCPGGDLFDVATSQREVLRPGLLRRIFAEVVGAVQYLHERRIVHRDIKLENVLVNLTGPDLADETIDWTTYPYSVITLTDLGLSRRIADDEKLETRCGSEDYAAPEVIMGQPYDGRATDAWSLGVLLYALLEARLPFDPHPGMTDAHRMRSRTSHRIARVEWCWVEYAGNDTDHDGDESKFEAKGLLSAMEITEGLLKRARSRWTVAKVAQQPWVKDAMQIEGGIRFREEQAGEEVS
ncbi:kinase-like protein, partial [Sarocladium strictum]